MRKTLTSLFALGLATGISGAALAQETDVADDPAMEFASDDQRFTDAGFEDAQVIQGVEAARMTHDGETFYVVKGLGRSLGMGADSEMGADAQMQVGDTAATGTETQLQPGETTATGADTDVEAGEAAAADLEEPTEEELATETQGGAAGTEDVAGMGASAEQWEGRGLDEILEQAGIENYEILDDLRVARTRLGEATEAGEVIVVYGVEEKTE